MKKSILYFNMLFPFAVAIMGIPFYLYAILKLISLFS